MDITRDAEEASACVAGGAYFSVSLAAHGDDVLDVAEGFDVVDNGGALVEADGGGEIGWFDAGVGALAFEGFDEASLFAADVGAGAAVDIDVEVVAGAEDVFAEEVFGACFFDGCFEDAGAFGEFAADVDVGEVDAAGVAGDDHALEELVRILVDDVAVFEGAWFGFVGVADEVDGAFFVGAKEGPLHACGEACAAASAELGFFDFLDDLGWLHGESLAELRIAAVAEVTLYVCAPVRAVHVFVEDATLAGVRLFDG